MTSPTSRPICPTPDKRGKPPLRATEKVAPAVRAGPKSAPHNPANRTGRRFAARPPVARFRKRNPATVLPSGSVPAGRLSVRQDTKNEAVETAPRPDLPRQDPVVTPRRKIIPLAGKFGFYLLVGPTPRGIVGGNRKHGNRQAPESARNPPLPGSAFGPRAHRTPAIPPPFGTVRRARRRRSWASTRQEAPCPQFPEGYSGCSDYRMKKGRNCCPQSIIGLW